MRTTQPHVRHVVQVTAFLGGKEPRAAAEEARNQTLRWLQKRAGPLPQDAWAGQGFEREIPGQHVSAVSLPDPPYWVARLDHPDSNVAGRSWSTEITVGVGKERSQFGLRLRCSSRDYNPDPALTIPGIVRQMAERPGLEDYGVPLSLKPWTLENEADVERMTRLLENTSRQRPVYVVSLPNDQAESDTALIDTADLAARCIGVAYVVILPSFLSFILTDRLGKEHSVFAGAVRSYMPSFTLDDQLPFKHPLALPDRIAGWPNGGPAAFADMLVRKAHEWSVRSSDREQNLPTYSFVKRIALARRETSLANEKDAEERILNLDAQIVELRRENEDWLSEVEQLTSRASEAETERDHLKMANRSLRIYVDELRKSLQAGGKRIQDEIPFPPTMKDVQTWVQRACPGRLVLLGRAGRGLKEAAFQNVKLVCQALLLLANEYRDMRLGGGPASKAGFDKACRQLRLECTPAFAGAGWGEFGDTYVVDWQGQKRRLDMHLKNNGNTRQPERCFRAYFFWDDGEQQVVVGWLPSHLETRLS